MTQYWRQDGTTLQVWTHMDDPETDAPIGETKDWLGVWGEYPDEAETLLLDWVKEQGIPNDIGYQDITRILIDLRAGEFKRI